MSATTAFRFDNTYARELPDHAVAWQPAAAPAPQLLFFNHALADELGLDAAALDTPEGAAVFAGNVVPEGAQPIAQAYAGHQFGRFSGQLGDGRALLLGEVIDTQGRRRDIAFKGSGATPFSRGGDGKAAIGPMLREVLIGEAMHALGIPTTRALAVAGTGEWVMRERPLPGAVLTRVAASHLRVGTFELYAARRQIDHLRKLADYAIARHDPDLQALDGPDKALALLRRVVERQARLMAQWMNVGFIHGVMNTDNMTLSGETIDYGPCAFMEAYSPNTVFSSIDEGGRYRFGHQPNMAQWNLARLAESLLPLMMTPEGGEITDEVIDAAVARATEVVNTFPALYGAALLHGQRAKLGLIDPHEGSHEGSHEGDADDPTDAALANDWLELLRKHAVDFTQAWRRLADAAAGDEGPLRALFEQPQVLDDWLGRWRARSAALDPLAQAERMRRVNPWIIPRNHQVEEALTAAAEREDMGPLHALLTAVRSPYVETADNARFGEPAPSNVTACYQTFCGT
ncbi:MAG: YdiU family protein [Aquabacterium sp.]